MEILNQNQRRSAIWRIVGLGIFILALILTILFSMHKAYASQGVGELLTLQAQYKKDQNKWTGERQGLENEIKRLKKELKSCKEDKDDSEALADCKLELKLTKQRNSDLENDLTRCETKLAACSSF